MSRVGGWRAIRRGAIVALDGLAIWLLAVLLATYTHVRAANAVDGSFYRLTIEIMRSWTRSPTVEALELAAYAGLALVVVGPFWYWVVHPVKAYLTGEGGQPSGETDAAVESNDAGGFEFADEASGEASITASDDMDPLTAEFDRVVSGAHRGRPPDWASVLFDGGEPPSGAIRPRAVPEGDFLRSPGSTETDRDDSPSTNVSLEDILVQPGNDQPVEAASAPQQTGVEATEVVSNGGARDQEPVEGPSEDDSHLETRQASDVSDGAAEDEPEGAATDRTREGAGRSTERDSETMDPVEAIGEAVDTAREKVDTVSERLVQPSMDSSVAAAKTDIADIRRQSDAFNRSLRGRIHEDRQTIGEEVKLARREQDRIESGFESLLGD